MNKPERKERPILFNGEMVRAILDGRKTQTRRIIKHPVPIIGPIGRSHYEPHWKGIGFNDDGRFSIQPDGSKYSNNFIVCPLGKPGDRLWVRETWAMTGDIHGEPYPVYKATADGLLWSKPWKPSIHMPRWASRINLEITGVRVERIQDISENEAIAEGVDFLVCPQCGCGGRISHGDNLKTRCPSPGCGLDYLSAIEGFKALWETAYPGSWDRQDWVWVIEFRKANHE